MLFAYLSDSVNITSVYEMYPIGWFSIRQQEHPDALTVSVARVRRGSRDFRSIPNLLYKAGGEVQATGFTHKPAAGYNNVRNDWSYYQDTASAGSVSKLIMLSPESHDPKISAAAGRGTYTMAEMEDWIPRALDTGVKGTMVWFFIGMPYQDRQSVLDTVAHSERLIRKFGGWKALPLICPVVPFLDPGSRFFEEPAQHDYRIFHRILEEHRQAVMEPLWRRRLNYKTRAYNRKILACSSDQIIPVRSPFGGQWFDDVTMPRQMIEDCLASRPGPASVAAT